MNLSARACLLAVCASLEPAPAALRPGVAWGAEAATADGPLIVPTRDVDVTYDLTGRDNAGTPRLLAERIRWAPAQGLVRVDPPTPNMYAVFQTKLHHLLIVRDDQRVVLLMEADQASVAPGLEHASGFERAGTATVAGLACTDWRTADSGGQATTVCLTADGVLLRARRDDVVLVQARAVTYAPLDPSTFAIPADYRTVRPPR
jgi:hypothetical protein